jgi:hypothetical protein
MKLAPMDQGSRVIHFGFMSSKYYETSRCYRLDIEIDLHDPDKTSLTDRMAA